MPACPTNPCGIPLLDIAAQVVDGRRTNGSGANGEDGAIALAMTAFSIRPAAMRPTLCRLRKMAQTVHALKNNKIEIASSWSSIFSVALGVASMITSELLPVSLLTPMASGLGISEGMAGQTVAVTALVAIFTSLFVTTLTKGIDRRRVVLGFSLLLTVSNLLVAAAPNYPVLLAGRLLLGLGLGGFWAMAASLALRLVRKDDVPKALSIVFGGVSVSLVIAAPAGSLLETLIGWRGVFLVASALGMVCLAWQALVLPAMPAPREGGHVGAVLAVFKRRSVPAAMLAILIVFTAQMGMLTYIRPLLETFAGFGVSGVSVLLLVFGVANFFGTSTSSIMLRFSLRLALTLPPLVTALSFAAILVSGGNHYVSSAAIMLWGVACGIVPVAWSTWVTRNLSDDAENAGSLQVAVIQLANALGAAVGGLIFDATGVTGPTFMGIALMLATFLLAATCVQAETGESAVQRQAH